MTTSMTREQGVEGCGRCCGSAGSRNGAAELYQLGKIHGFLHLYIGEEVGRWSFRL
ncbi:MAG: hypothetical protein MRJ92_01630 [Nitrospira sp.]|nr:hypothetical protein [Nitrospira sp.]